MPRLSNPISETEAVFTPNILQNKSVILNTFSYNHKHHTNANNIYKVRTYVICGSHTWFTFPKRSPFEKGWYGISLNWSGMSHGPQPAELSCIIGAVKCGTSSSPNILSVITPNFSFQNNHTQLTPINNSGHGLLAKLGNQWLWNWAVVNLLGKCYNQWYMTAISLCLLYWLESTFRSIKVTLLVNNFSSWQYELRVRSFC